jgi:Protein of unknown function (DUF3995)
MAVLAIVNAFVFFALGSLHFYWAMGFKWRTDVVVPTHTNGEKVFQASVASCLVVGVGLWLMAVIHLANAGWWLNEFPLIIIYSTLAIAFIFTMRAIGDFKWVGLFKQITTTPFAKNDTRYYVPLCVFLSTSALLLFFLR